MAQSLRSTPCSRDELARLRRSRAPTVGRIVRSSSCLLSLLDAMFQARVAGIDERFHRRVRLTNAERSSHPWSPRRAREYPRTPRSRAHAGGSRIHSMPASQPTVSGTEAWLSREPSTRREEIDRGPATDRLADSELPSRHDPGGRVQSRRLPPRRSSDRRSNTGALSGIGRTLSR
jgi:hypothetical protein